MVNVNDISAGISGFPEITSPQPRCKLCNLAQTNPVLVHITHELYGRRELSGNPLYRKLKPLFSESEAPMPSPNAFVRHLSQHISTALISDDWRTRSENANTSSMDDHESDYLEMRRLYANLRPIIAQAQIDVATRKGRKSDEISPYDLMALLKLYEQATKMLKALSDMRNSERLLKMMLTRHTESLVNLMTMPLGSKLREVQDKLIRGDDPSDVALEIESLLGEGLFPMFEHAAKQALDQSKQQYKLH